nr:hypothetical protein [uncultured Cupriavidus sp.]
MNFTKHAVVAAALSCGLVGGASAHTFVGVDIGLPAPAMAVPVAPVVAYPQPVYYPPLPAYAAPAYVPATPVGYIAGPGWYGRPYHPWHVGFGYWHH